MLDADALEKATRFVDLCDGFGLPLVFLQDLPGVMIGLESERQGIAQGVIAPVHRHRPLERPRR